MTPKDLFFILYSLFFILYSLLFANFPFTIPNYKFKTHKKTIPARPHSLTGIFFLIKCLLVIRMLSKEHYKIIGRNRLGVIISLEIIAADIRKQLYHFGSLNALHNDLLVK